MSGKGRRVFILPFSPLNFLLSNSKRKKMCFFFVWVAVTRQMNQYSNFSWKLPTLTKTNRFTFADVITRLCSFTFVIACLSVSHHRWFENNVVFHFHLCCALYSRYFENDFPKAAENEQKNVTNTQISKQTKWNA